MAFYFCGTLCLEHHGTTYSSNLSSQIRSLTFKNRASFK